MGIKNSILGGWFGATDVCAKLSPTNSVPEPDGPPETDPRLPLDARQTYKLQKSWKGIKRKITDAAIELFVR